MFSPYGKASLDEVFFIFTLGEDAKTGSLCNNVKIVRCTPDNKCRLVVKDLPTVYNATKVKSKTVGNIKVTVFMNKGEARRDCYKGLYPNFMGKEFSLVQVEDLENDKSSLLPFESPGANNFDFFLTTDGIIRFFVTSNARAVVYALERAQLDSNQWKLDIVNIVYLTKATSGKTLKEGSRTYVIFFLESTSDIYMWNGTKVCI